MDMAGQPQLEGYRDCHLCTVQEKTRARRCYHCTGQLGLRDQLFLEIERRWRLRAAPYISAIVPGLGHWYAGRRYTGTFFLAIAPLSLGLVLATNTGWSWGLAVLFLSFVLVWALSIQDARQGQSSFMPPCQDACPGKVPCSQYVHLASIGMYRESLEILETACPFPGTIGRICHHPCEQDCNRGKDGQPVAICGIKRFVDDRSPHDHNIYLQELQKAPFSVGRKVAVVGAGPSGLTAALFLRLLGFEVSLFEARQFAGGTPAMYIPSYRLPADVYRREVDRILELGVETNFGKALGRDFTLQDLARGGYGAVYLAMGAMRSVRLPHTGDESQGFLDWRVVLERAVLGEGIELPGDVLVIGGGNVAMDVARTALRCGAGKVRVICLEKKPESQKKVFSYRNGWEEVKPPRTMEFMPAFIWEIDEAVEEGVEIMGAGATVSFDLEDGKVVRAHCQAVDRIDVDPSGRLLPVLAAGSDFTVSANWVITAVGSGPDYSFMGGRPPMKPVAPGTSLHQLDEGVPAGLPVLVGGDFTARPASVIEAIAAGREAALYLFRLLAGTPRVSIRYRKRRLLHPWANYEDSLDKRSRRREACSPLSVRRQDFSEVSSGFTESVGRQEADRCMRCDWPLTRESKVRKFFRAVKKGNSGDRRQEAGG